MRQLIVLGCSGRSDPGIDALEGGDRRRHIADLVALAVHAEVEDALAQMQVAGLEPRELGAAQPVIEHGGEDSAVAQPLQRVGRRPLNAARRVVGDGVLFAEIVIERGQRRELAAHDGAGEGPGFQRAAPGDDMGPGDLAQFHHGADADEPAELANVALIGAARVLVADVGRPFDFRRDVGEAVELRGGQPPPLAVPVPSPPVSSWSMPVPDVYDWLPNNNVLYM